MNTSTLRTEGGFSLIEVLIAVVVLSFGLLALAALQGSLFRAGAESKARANATAIAQAVVENAKTFAYLTSPDPATYPVSGTYAGLATANLGTQEINGTTYHTCRQVWRYRSSIGGTTFSGLAATAAEKSASPASVSGGGVSMAGCTSTAGSADVPGGGVAEFKEVRVTVAWMGSDAQLKSVALTDTIAAVAPADAIQVVKAPLQSSRGPEVWIEPPNKDNPQVVPIAIGGDQSAASSNPKPEQFVQDVSAATLFSVQTFSGSTSGSEVRLNRKLDVAAVSCVCQQGSGTASQSSATNPAYQPTVWNGKQLAYLEPLAAPLGTKIATPVVSNSSPEIESLCTVCCRDHHETSTRQPRPDPYRALTSAEANGAEHWGYKKQGNSFRVGDGLFPAGADTSGQYVEACQLIRVNGLMRMAVDAQQNQLLVTPLNDARTGYRQSDFISRYSGFVSSLVADGMASLPPGYPGPTARFPAASATLLGTYDDIVNPPAIALLTGDVKKLVAFGLYVDYLSADTLKAYDCASTKNNTGDCAGLGGRNPLEVLPFYAVNVANLGSWASARAGVAAVVNATYSNQGLLSSDGGVVSAGSSSSSDPVPVSIEINNSNSGLAGTQPVDPDDKSDFNFVKDFQGFTKASGTTGGSRNSLFIRVGASSTLTLSTILVTSPAGGTQCTYANKSATTTCRFDSPAASLTVGLTNYTTSAKVKGTTVITNRKVCVPFHLRVSQPAVVDNGLVTESSTITLNTLLQLDYTLTIDIVNEADACPTGTAPFSP
ncbi:MAG: type IV pilus modification PilV family protein [Luteimonas sp.]